MDFPAQVRSGGVSRRADDADDLPGCHLLVRARAAELAVDEAWRARLGYPRGSMP